MKTVISAFAKSVLLSIALLVIVGASHSTARADEVTLAGFTTGAITGVPQLSFAGNQSFTGTTFLGVGSLSGANNLGTFFLNAAPGSLVAGSFTLNITFTTPSGINGGQGATYTATVIGSVAPIANNGGVSIKFANASQVFTFSNANGAGSFSLTMADVFLQTGQQVNLTAGITGEQSSAPVPEPATLLLLGSGLTGLAATARRRMRLKRLKE